MANIKSQIKRIKTNHLRELKNMGIKSAIKTHISKFNKAVESQDKESAAQLMKKTIVAIDKAVSDGILHANNAAHKKSSLMKKYQLLINAKPAETATPEEKPAKKSPAKKTAAKKTAAKPKTKKA